MRPIAAKRWPTGASSRALIGTWRSWNSLQVPMASKSTNAGGALNVVSPGCLGTAARRRTSGIRADERDAPRGRSDALGAEPPGRDAAFPPSRASGLRGALGGLLRQRVQPVLPRVPDEPGPLSHRAANAHALARSRQSRLSGTRRDETTQEGERVG